VRSAGGSYATLVKWIAIAVIAVSVFLILRHLPVERGRDAFAIWLARLGIWGPLVFGLIYIMAVVLLVPGSALTLVAGAIFGLAAGTAIVSLASTTGPALVFLIARYLARERIAQQIHRYPKFEAIDKAISDEGWKIVALLRLSPALPFNLQNYLYGLTGIGFWTCVLTSWVAMLPGTFMYIYLGNLGRAGLEAAEGKGKSPAEWAVIVVGLLATIAVTIYITHVARRAIKERTTIAEVPEDEVPPTRSGWWSASVTAAVAVLTLAGALFIQFNPELVKRWCDKLPGATP
jgi:uncharacterized membrane protein YdjX (TVP38/TMEM64 family)